MSPMFFVVLGVAATKQHGAAAAAAAGVRAAPTNNLLRKILKSSQVLRPGRHAADNVSERKVGAVASKMNQIAQILKSNHVLHGDGVTDIQTKEVVGTVPDTSAPLKTPETERRRLGIGGVDNLSPLQDPQVTSRTEKCPCSRNAYQPHS